MRVTVYECMNGVVKLSRLLEFRGRSYRSTAWRGFWGMPREIGGRIRRLSAAVRGWNDDQLSHFFGVTEVSKYRSIKVVWFSKS